ncbi:MAG: haloacid dehalogenase-like hydrolase [Pirellulales bacterium]|nr:haloacid dehalogenase-like hydrolase [Pirellulales bacterium]
MYLVLFDIDGTLIKTGGAGQVAFFETIRQDFGVPEIPTSIPFAGRSDRAIAGDIMRASGIDPTEQAWQRFSKGYLRRLEQALSRCEGKILPGVLQLLNALERCEHAFVGLLTGNIEKGAQTKLSRYGLAERFSFGGFGDLRTDRNDIAADARQAAVDYLSSCGLSSCNGSTISKVMVIGDTPNDVTCARSIGAFAVAVATGGSSREELARTSPDLLLDDLTETDALLAEIESHAARPGNLAARP